jgi:hypothetical protein
MALKDNGSPGCPFLSHSIFPRDFSEPQLPRVRTRSRPRPRDKGIPTTLFDYLASLGLDYRTGLGSGLECLASLGTGVLDSTSLIGDRSGLLGFSGDLLRATGWTGYEAWLDYGCLACLPTRYSTHSQTS